MEIQVECPADLRFTVCKHVACFHPACRIGSRIPRETRATPSVRIIPPSPYGIRAPLAGFRCQHDKHGCKSPFTVATLLSRFAFDVRPDRLGPQENSVGIRGDHESSIFVQNECCVYDQILWGSNCESGNIGSGSNL